MIAIIPILFYLFVSIVLLQILYHVFVFGSLSLNKKEDPKIKRLPVSLIVYIENNEEQLNHFLAAIRNQSYPIFEIVLVNNASYDESLEIIKQFAQTQENVKIVNVENNESFWGNKRYALTLGIKVAKYDYLLFCEPTAIPDSAMWITNMTSHFTLNRTIVLGHQRIEVVKKSIWNKLIRFHNATWAAYNFSWGNIGKPLFGNNKNLAYKKDEFYKINGFINQMNQNRGEDFYFTNTITTSKNTATSLTKTSFTASYTKPSFENWVKDLKIQSLLFSKLRFSSKIKVYFYSITKIPYFILTALLLSLLYNWEIVLGLFVLRSIIVALYSHKYLKHFQEKDLSLWFPVLEFIHTFTTGFIFIKNLLSQKKN